MTRGGTATPWSGPPPARRPGTTSSPCPGCVRSGRPSTCTIPRCSPWTTRSPTRHSWAAAPAARKERPNEHPGAQTAADRGTPAAHRAVQADAPRGGLLRRPGVLLPAGVHLVRPLVVLGAGRVDRPAALRGPVG